jgi:hypothetical protein
MKANSFHFEMDRGVGVRASATALLSYELNVFAEDPLDAVRHAGGWMCDRVRAGWKVTVVLPSEPDRDVDTRALDILGVRTRAATAELGELVQAPALAVSARLLATDPRLRRAVRHALERGGAEVTLWGEAGGRATELRVTDVRYPMTPAARAFKSQAMLAAAGVPEPGAAEHFYSCAPWYPLDGPDLISVK